MKAKKTFQIKMVLIALFTLFSVNIFAQHTVTGTVLDDLGESAVGVTIREKGTSNGAATDINGKFTITVSNPSAVLQVSSIGFTTQEIKVAGKKVLSIKLVEDKKLLNETVVVGYGTMKKSDISGASVTVGEDKLKTSIITSLDQALQGQAAGVNAVQTSGAPGSSTSIRVRGTATVLLNAEPLYVIDGVIVQSQTRSGNEYGLGDALGNSDVSTISPLSTIDPADIVSMEILKDASATAIYGAQGANGVVLITTKHGKPGDAKFNYTGSFAYSRQTKRLDILNLREYAEYYQQFVDLGEAEPNAILSDQSLLGVGTNWQDAIFQTAFQHNHQISAQGGNEKIRYYVSGSYMNQEGTIIGSKFDRLSLRTNLDADLKSWLKLGLNLSYTNSNDDLKLADSDEGIINYSLTTTPNLPIYDIDGSYASHSYQGSNNPNPIAMALLNTNTLNRQKFNGNIFFDVKFYKDLVWHTELGFDIGSSQAERYRPIIELNTYHQSENRSAIQKNSNKYYQIKNYLTWSHQFDKHRVTGMLGHEVWESKYNFLSLDKANLPSDDVHNPALASKVNQEGYAFGSSAMVSYFTRWTYSYDDRYNATYTFRRDASSNFGPENRWASFHSFAASWRFSNEAFMEKTKSWLSNGKLRLGWGQTGNANIGGYKWGTGMKTQTSALGSGSRPVGIANRGIKWESQEQFNIGLDLSFLNDRISATIDWYRKESKDLLTRLQLPSYMGTSGNQSSWLEAPWGNFGTLRNTGIEISISAHPMRGDFQWDIEGQVSFNRNKLVDYNCSLLGYGQWSGQEPVVAQTFVGESLFDFYGYVCDGVYTSLEDIENSPKPLRPAQDGTYIKNSTVYVGDIKYKDLSGPNGVPDGVIDDFDRTNLGSPFPKASFGLTNTFRYKNFDLNIFITGSIGNKVGNFTKWKLTKTNNVWTNQLADVRDAAKLVPIDPNKDYSNGVQRIGDGQTINNWYDDITNVRIGNEGTSTPRVSVGDPNNNSRWSDRYIEDGSYVRLKNISLGYTIPKALCNRMQVDNIRVYANIQNLWTITGYSGYDPEVGASTQNQFVFGLDNGRYPSPTTYSFGINVSF